MSVANNDACRYLEMICAATNLVNTENISKKRNALRSTWVDST